MPVGVGAEQWVTVAAERTLLAVARTVTSTARVLDAVQVLRDDARVQIVFAHNDSSPFNDGVLQLLQRAGARVVPWGQLTDLRFDAAVTSSENTEFQAIDAPVLVLQHGVGFHKILPNSRGAGRRLAGSVRADDLRGRRMVIAVTHPQQTAQLAAFDADVAERTVLIADPVLERLRASRLLRERYREELRLEGRRLVVISSTWGQHSLIGRWPQLPARLLAQLDADGFRVATLLHPNVTAGHGALQVRLWLAAARDAGLLMVPPDAGWQAMLAAADCLVGDHSSVSLLAAGADIPLLLAPLGIEVVPGTPMTELSRVARSLDVRLPLAEQVFTTVSTHVPGMYAEAVDATFAEVPAARPLRSVLYELLGLPEPDEPEPLIAWPVPAPDTITVGSFLMRSRVCGEAIEVGRFPAAVRRHVSHPEDGWTSHLSAGDQEWDLRMLQSADVLTRAAVLADSAAWDWTRATLDRFPGSAMACAATVDGCVATFRDGRRVVATGSDVTALGAGLYALARDRHLGDGAWQLRTARGGSTIVVRLLHRV